MERQFHDDFVNVHRRDRLYSFRNVPLEVGLGPTPVPAGLEEEPFVKDREWLGLVIGSRNWGAVDVLSDTVEK